MGENARRHTDKHMKLYCGHFSALEKNAVTGYQDVEVSK